MTLAQQKPSNLEIDDAHARRGGEIRRRRDWRSPAPERKTAGLHAMAQAIRSQAAAILAANAEDMSRRSAQSCLPRCSIA